MSTPHLSHSRIDVTAEQRAIVDHLHAHPVTVVSAGAGAGKTYTTVAAVVELIAGDQVQADGFALITFTNHAADELRGRLHAEVAKQVQFAVNPTRRAFWLEQRERLSASYIGTIHGFCKQILSLYGYAQGIAREASVSMSRRLRKASIEAMAIELLKPESTAPVADLVMNGAWPEYEMREFLDKMLADGRNRGINLNAMLAATEKQLDDQGKPIRICLAKLLVEAEKRYEASSNQEQQLDAAALLLRSAELLESEYGGDVTARIAQRFRYLFIDEFQDTSATQMQIASKLATRLTTVVVGDRKQAIYAFAGANESLLMKFANQHQTKPLPLSLSGRPSKPLLRVQTALFSSMRARFPDLDEPLQPSERNLDPNDSLPPCVTLMATDDDEHADEHAALRIKALLGTSIDRGPEGTEAPIVEPGDIAVLVRTNDEVTTWVVALNAQGIPARSDTGTPLLRRPEVVAMYRFLQLLARYPDDVALVEALATPHFQDVDLSEEEARILSYGFLRGTPLTDRLKEHYPVHHRRLEALRTYSLAATVPQMLGRIEEEFDLKNRYRQAGDEAAALALDRLRDYARSRFDSDQALTLRTFLEMLRRDIMNDTDLPEPASAEQGRSTHVKVMTIHRAKGSEFPIVVIPNLEAIRSPQRPPDFILDTEHGLEVNLYRWRIQTASDSFWAYVRREEARSIAEEMRLFYVAITRAERVLLLLGRDLPPPGPERPVHRWQTSVLDAKQVLEQCGARFGPLVRSPSP